MSAIRTMAADPLNILRSRGIYALGRYRVDAEKYRLYCDGALISEDERTVEFLWLLICGYPNTVRKDDLIRALWPNVVVTDWSLSRLVSDTRQLLDDNGEQQRLIRTVRGSGFKLLVEPVQVSDALERSRDNTDAVISTAPTSEPIRKATRRHVWIAGIFLTLVLASAWTWMQRSDEQSLRQSMQALHHYQDMSFTAFKAQVARREELAAMIETRLSVKRSEEYEKFFAKYFSQMNADERFAFDQIRAITLGHLYEANQGMLNEIQRNPKLAKEIPALAALRQHLVFWLQKYRTVFLNRIDMCVLYAGVEDGVPYPTRADQDVKDWLAKNQ